MPAFASLPFWLFLSGEPWTKIMLASSDWAGLEGDTQKESSKADLGIYMQRAISTKNGGKSLPQGIHRKRSSAATKRCWRILTSRLLSSVCLTRFISLEH